MDDKKPLSLINMESVSDAILEMVAKYPDFPFIASKDTILWQSIQLAIESIGIFTAPGACYLKKYITGSFIALLPIQLIYKCNPSSNSERMTSQQVLENLAIWLEKSTATFTNPQLSLTSIERTSPVFKRAAEQNGFWEYTCTLNIKYSVEKRRF